MRLLRNGRLTAPLALGLAVCATLALSDAPASANTRAEVVFAAADVNLDGVISRQEVVELRLRRFDIMDRNNNGVLDVGDTPRAAIFHQQALWFQEMLIFADGNKDGVVTYEELAVAPTPLFDVSDLNGDGVLTADEI